MARTAVALMLGLLLQETSMRRVIQTRSWLFT